RTPVTQFSVKRNRPRIRMSRRVLTLPMPSMLVVGQQLALVAAAIFTGAAIHINVAEQPARLQLDPGPPTCTMEAQLRARIDLAILARDRVGCARCAGLFWQLGLALAAWSGADPRQLALHPPGSSGQQPLQTVPPLNKSWRRRRREPQTSRHATWSRPGANFMQCVARSGLVPPWSIYGRRCRLSAKARSRTQGSEGA